jgi:hypothetical protein
MPGLRELLGNTGVPQDNYIVVPHDSYNVVWLEGVKGSVSFTHDSKTSISKVTKDNASRIAESISRNHTSGHKSGGDYNKELLARMLALVNSNPGQTLAIAGKKPGFGTVTFTADGKTYKAETGVTTQSPISVGFRFLQHTDGSTKVADTAYTPKDAAGWIATLNRIYGPQANVIFDLVDTDWVTLASAASQPIGKDFFLKSIAVTPAKGKVNLHLVGKWGGGSSGHSRGTYFDETGIAVITDQPGQDEIPQGIDPFMLTMAHELLHFIREKRGMPKGHPGRDNILLSSKIQTLRIDKQMSIDINPPG